MGKGKLCFCNIMKREAKQHNTIFCKKGEVDRAGRQKKKDLWSMKDMEKKGAGQW